MTAAPASPFPALSRPGQIGGMHTRNRIIMPAMDTNLAAEDGAVTPALVGYYEERAAGGAGLIITEIAYIDIRGKTTNRQLAVDDDSRLPGLGLLAEAIKKHGTRAVLQLHHAGREGSSKFSGLPPVAPSAVPVKWAELSQELTLSQIQGVIDSFARAAQRAKKAGFDAVEVHACHGYLGAQFLSAAWNRRTDRYGGSLANRARFIVEVLGSIKELVGRDYPVICRLNAVEYGVENGVTLEETGVVAGMVRDAGADCISISAFGYGTYVTTNLPDTPGALAPFAEDIKKVVDVPVVAVGRITPELGEKILREGKADFIAMGRSLIADPMLPNKLFSRQLDDIVPCIACLNCIPRNRAPGTEDTLMRCTVNATVGREISRRPAAATRRKKIVVIGGGPAGMQAAIIAASRGHAVVLYEQAAELGGQLAAAAAPPFKNDIAALTSYLVKQVRKAGIEVKLGARAVASDISNIGADAVVVAAGSFPVMPPVKGLADARPAIAEDVLLGKSVVGGKRVAIMGGGLIGCETADFLAEAGKDVVLMSRQERLALKMGAVKRRLLLDRLAARGITLLKGIKYREVNGKTVLVQTSQGELEAINADTIVVAGERKPDIGLAAALRGKVGEVYLAGDCVEPRGILEAIQEGYDTGCRL